ncbi:hypothetical protein QBE54_08000 [Thermatribacter velox]|uniref:Uncharacterized protein n=1 Tax=Thermatribacter velox TaxID=3039681 RepID=A0ABZ2Y949_9BACT
MRFGVAVDEDLMGKAEYFSAQKKRETFAEKLRNLKLQHIPGYREIVKN